MKRLRKEFENNGLTYNQLARSSNYVVFSVYDPVDEINTFEVVRIIKRSLKNPLSNTAKGREFYPGKKLASDNVWQFKSLKNAFDKFKTLY